VEIAHRSLVYTTKLLTELGIPVIIDATAPRRSWREMARAMIGHFAEVQLVCPPEICGDRERAVRWNLTLSAHARPHGAGNDAPEVVLGYEHALNPDLTVHTHLQDLWSATEEVLRLAERLHRAALRSTRDTRRSVR
jgi:adenylylsulfate kinase